MKIKSETVYFLIFLSLLLGVVGTIFINQFSIRSESFEILIYKTWIPSISILLLSILLIKGYNNDILEPARIIGILYIVTWVVAPIIHLLTNKYILPHSNNPAKIICKAQYYAFISLLCFCFGYYSQLPRTFVDRYPFSKITYDKENLKIIIWLFAILGFLFYVVYINYGGGILHFLNYRGWRSLLVTSRYSEYFSMGANLLITSFLLFYVLFVTNKTDFILRFTNVCSLVLIIVLFTLLQGRWRIILPLISMLVIRHYLVKRISLSFLIVTLVIGFVWAAAMIEFRGGAKLFMIENPLKFVKGLIPSYETMFVMFLNDVGHVDPVMCAFELFPKSHDFLWGNSIIFGIFGPIMSKISSLTGIKFYSAGMLLTSLAYSIPYERLTGGSVPTMLGELYINFSFYGIVIGFFLYGIFLRTIYLYVSENTSDRRIVFIYAILYPNLIILLHSNFNLIFHTMLILLPGIFAIRFGKIRINKINFNLISFSIILLLLSAYLWVKIFPWGILSLNALILFSLLIGFLWVVTRYNMKRY